MKKHFHYVFSVSAVFVLALSVLVPANAQNPAASNKSTHSAHQAHAMFDACAKDCALCQIECGSCYAHCAALVIAGNKEHANSMALCNDCAELCGLAASLTARGSRFSASACESCAKACDECAEACGAFKDDAHLQECAQSCRDCAAACRKMVEHMGHQHN